MHDETRTQIERTINYRFRDADLLALALTHASVAEARVRSNERLEFLGDAVLGLVVCERVYAAFPNLLEGEMTKIKSTVVSRQSCAGLAQQLDLARHLAIGKGMRVHESLPQSLAAAVIESIVAAIYLDGGLEPARQFLLPLVEPLIQRAFESGHQENFKSILQQHAQQRLEDTPSYVVLEQKGPDHAKHFHVCVQIGDRRYPSSWGPSKKQAEQQAALLALYELGVTAIDDAGKVRVVVRGSGGKNGLAPDASGSPAGQPGDVPADVPGDSTDAHPGDSAVSISSPS